MEKIYSRRRIHFFPSNNKSFKSLLKRIKIARILVIVIAFQTATTILNHVNPIYEKICKDEVKNLATKITNEQSGLVMKKYSYDDMFKVEKDNNGNITMIKTNIYPINNIISEIALKTQEELENSSSKRNLIRIPIGSITGVEIFEGAGPKFDLSISLLGNIDTELKSEFIAQGINQTLHRVYLQLDCNMQIVSSYKKMEENICNQILLVENIIVGQIPQNYYNLQGLNGYDETLTTIK